MICVWELLNNYDLDSVVIRVVQADVDIMLFGLNELANKNSALFEQECYLRYKDLADKVITIIEKAVKNNIITEDRINKSFNRIVTLKNKVFK